MKRFLGVGLRRGEKELPNLVGWSAFFDRRRQTLKSLFLFLLVIVLFVSGSAIRMSGVLAAEMPPAEQASTAEDNGLYDFVTICDDVFSNAAGVKLGSASLIRPVFHADVPFSENLVITWSR